VKAREIKFNAVYPVGFNLIDVLVVDPLGSPDAETLYLYLGKAKEKGNEEKQ